MTFEQIIGDLKKKIYYPVYFLTGDESYYIDEISDFIEDNVLSDVEKEFNQTVVYGRDTDVPSIISYAKRYPMMSNYQVVIVKEAQDVEDIENLASYVEKPLDTTLLVINYKYKKIDKRKSFVKQIGKTGVFFESPVLYDNKVAGWITDYVVKKGYRISPKASVILAEYLGSNLSKIVNEVGKLFINVPSGAEIDATLIEQNIGISKDFNFFEFQNAIGSRDVVKANRIANYFAANPKDNPLIRTITLLFSFFSKLLIYHQLENKSRNNIASALSINPFFVQDYQVAARNFPYRRTVQMITLLREYDLKSKGVNNVSTSEGELLKELLFKMLH
jgi:DNA polymerase-3 subunit delta